MNHQRYHVTTEIRRGHRLAHRHNHHHAQPVQVQEIRGHSNFHARRGNMHRGHSNFHDHRGNLHNLLSRAFLQELLSERIGNVKRGSSEEIIARQMLTKTNLLPNNLEGSTSEEQEIDLCIICQVQMHYFIVCTIRNMFSAFSY